MTHAPALWLGFSGLVLILLVLDLGVLNRRSHTLSLREASVWSGALVTIALLFGGFIWWMSGVQPALEYYTGYLIELSLSVDNLFVFILIFQYFQVPPELRAKVLKWGIMGAIIMRAVMIGVGALLIARFHWITWVFGGILILAGIKMFRGGHETIRPEKNPVLRLTRRLMPTLKHYHGDAFFVKRRGLWMATPLFLAVVFVEWSDLVFAIDSIPAIFAVTRDPFIVYSSNVFAILGLRALFFVLASVMDRFVYLAKGVAIVLLLVGVKMVAAEWVRISTPVSLAAIGGILSASVALSLWASRPRPEEI